MSFVLYLTNNIGPTKVGVGAFSTMVLLTLITNCNSGALLATQHTHFCLILCPILRGGRVALVSPNMRRDMLPWSIGGVTDLPPDAKLCKMQQSVDCVSLTPTQGATQQSVDCESLTPTQGAMQQSVDSEIVPVSSIAPEGWGTKEGGNAMSPLHSRGSPNKGGQNQK